MNLHHHIHSELRLVRQRRLLVCLGHLFLSRFHQMPQAPSQAPRVLQPIASFLSPIRRFWFSSMDSKPPNRPTVNPNENSSGAWDTTSPLVSPPPQHAPETHTMPNLSHMRKIWHGAFQRSEEHTSELQ